MTYPPQQNFDVRNDGVGLTTSGRLPQLVVGYSPLLTPGTLYQLSNPNKARSQLGMSPALEEVLACIATRGVCLFLCTAASTAGTISVVTPDRVGSSDGTVTVTGTSGLEFEGRVQIVRGGKLGVGTYRYTLDGVTWSATRTLPAGGSFSVPNTALVLGFVGTPGSSTVVNTGGGPTVTVTGTPVADYDFVIEITTAGAVETAVFRWSSNGGATWNTGVTTASTVALGATGVTANFAAGSYVLAASYEWTSYTSVATDFETGDEHTFSTTAPHYTTANLSAAWGNLLGQLGSREFDHVIFTGRNADTGDGALMAAACAALLSDLEGSLYFVRGMVDAGSGTAAEYRADYAAFADDRIATPWSDVRRTVRAPFEGYASVRGPGLTAAAERAAQSDLSENLGRKASGALTRVVAIYHDEGTDPQFGESERVLTFRTWQGEPGFFITNGYLRSSPNSDFAYWDWGCTIDMFCRCIRKGQDKWFLAKLRTETDGTGNLQKIEAGRIETAVLGVASAALKDPINVEGYKGHVSGLGYTVDTTNDFLGTREILSTGNAVPLAPVEGFSTTVGLARSV